MFFYYYMDLKNQVYLVCSGHSKEQKQTLLLLFFSIAFERWMIPRIDGLQYGQKAAGIDPIKKTNNMADMAYGLVV
jgi:hypothetical protein